MMRHIGSGTSVGQLPLNNQRQYGLSEPLR
jgi:hypothetical protein